MVSRMDELSVREVAGRYLGIGGAFSVVGDVFGAPPPPGTSLRDKLESIVVVAFRKNIPDFGGISDLKGWR